MKGIWLFITLMQLFYRLDIFSNVNHLKTVSGMALGSGRERIPNYVTSSDHVARTSTVSWIWLCPPSLKDWQAQQQSAVREKCCIKDQAQAWPEGTNKLDGQVTRHRTSPTIVVPTPLLQFPPTAIWRAPRTRWHRKRKDGPGSLMGWLGTRGQGESGLLLHDSPIQGWPQNTVMRGNPLKGQSYRPQPGYPLCMERKGAQVRIYTNSREVTNGLDSRPGIRKKTDWKTRDKKGWGRGMWMELCEWAQSLNIFEVNVHQTTATTEETLNNQVNRKTQRADISQPLSLAIVLAEWVQEQSSHDEGNGGNTWDQKYWLHSPRLIQLLLLPNVQTTDDWDQCWVPPSFRTSQALLPWRGNNSPWQASANILNMGLLLLSTGVQPTPLSKCLHSVWSNNIGNCIKPKDTLYRKGGAAVSTQTSTRCSHHIPHHSELTDRRKALRCNWDANLEMIPCEGSPVYALNQWSLQSAVSVGVQEPRCRSWNGPAYHHSYFPSLKLKDLWV